MAPSRWNRKRSLVVVGLMSGTSADGIDAVVARIGERPPTLSASILACETYPHPPLLAAILLKLGEVGPDPSTDRVELLSRAHFALGWALGRVVIEVALKARLPLEKIDLIGSHGQTVRHLPACDPIGDLSARSTLQIGEASCIVELTGVPVVSDLRVADVAAGGQGAPLVPYADRLLFARPGRTLALQNFGGIGNVTYLPDPTTGSPLIAFDTGPGNMVMDAIVRGISGGRETYDVDGRRAARGRVDAKLVETLLSDRFFEIPPPRTAGREQYGRAFVERFVAACEERDLAPDDQVATATRFTAAATALSYRRFVFPRGVPDEVIVSGGGALNPTLIGALADELSPVKVLDSGAYGIPAMAKEALAFAVLAYERVRERPANCPEATGAPRKVVLGKLTV